MRDWFTILQEWFTIDRVNLPDLLIAFGLGIIFCLLGVIFSRPKRKPFYIVDDVVLLGGENSALPKEVGIFYEGKEVKSLSKTNIIFWNGGNKTIRKEDVNSEYPLKIYSVSGSNLLKASCLVMSKPENLVKLIPSKDQESKLIKQNELIIEFEWLEKRQGFNIEVLHTGLGDVGLTGSIVDVDRGLKLIKSNPDDWRRKTFSEFMAPVGLYMSSISEEVNHLSIGSEERNSMAQKKLIENIPEIIGILFISTIVFMVGLYFARLFIRLWPTTPPEDLIK